MKYLTNSGLSYFFNKLKTYISNALSSKANSTHTHSASDITSGLATVATSGSYNDLSNKPTIPTVNNATLTIQKNGTTVKTFTANASSNVTCNITVPTKTSDLTNDSGFLTSSGSCNYANSAGSASSATTAETVSTSVADGSYKDLVCATMAGSDAFRIRCGGDDDDGWVEIATSDNGNEPIYIRQYRWNGNTPGSFDNIVRTLTLLDESGNTQFPGTVTANTFTGNLNGNCSGTAGGVAWNNVSGRPTAVSQFTNDSNFVNSLNNYTSFSWDTPVSGKLNIKVDQTWLGGILTTANTTIPTNTSDLTNDSGFITADYAVPRSGGAVITGDSLGRNVDDDNLRILGGNAWNSGAQLQLCGKNLSGGLGGTFTLYANSGDEICALRGTPSGVLMWGGKNLAMQEDVVPRNGGSVLTGTDYFKTTNNSYICIGGGTNWGDGATVTVNGATRSSYTGYLILAPNNGAITKGMYLEPDGTWTWNGTACQITSDQRLKQQISEIDDKLLDAWEDVDLVQFKYNDAVDQKGKDKARLHTGYVVQQIDNACKSHGVDISEYGLYCHEEYPEETEEVEVENEDGTTTKETKVIREASEHYSLRYTEVYAVECMYLRRENSRLKEKLASIEERLEKLEKAEK